MDTIYHQTNRLLHEITQKDFAILDRSQTFHEYDQNENNFKEKLNEVYSNINKLEKLLCKEQPHRRSTGKYKIDQLKYDVQHVASSFKTLQQRRYIWLKEMEEREELLNRKFTVNDEHTNIFIDNELSHHTKLQDANTNIDEIIGVGSSIMESLKDQGSILKGAQKKVLDLANTLGLSNTVMRLIERRSTQDKFVLYGGMIFVLLCLYFILMYL